MTNENKDILPYIPFDAPLHLLRELDIPIPDFLEKEINKVDLPDSSASLDASTASPTSTSDATESSTTTALSDASPNDSNSSASLDASTASPTSTSDATESSTTTALSDASPNDSNSSASFDASTASPTSTSENSSSSNEPEEETFLRYGRKMTWEQIQNLSNNPKQRDQFEKSSKIYYEMKHSPSSTYSFFESKRRKQCRKVPVPELDSESILLYEPIAAHMRSQNLFENKLAREHFEDPIYVMFVNWIFEVLGFIGTPPLLFGNTNLSLADFIGIFRLTFSITKVQDYRKHHTFVEFMKLVESLAATTGANIAWVVQDSDPLGKNGLWSSWFTDKILENDAGLKELVDFYKKVVEFYQKCALPISIRIIKNMIQKNKVSGNKENKETGNLGEEGAKYFMVEAQSGKYLKHFPDCCKQASAVYMHSFKNGNADMKKIQAYHPSTQNNGYDGKADGLMTLGLFHRAYFVYLSILSIIHRQNFNDIFVNENGEFDFKRLLKDAGVAGVKGVNPHSCQKILVYFVVKLHPTQSSLVPWKELRGYDVSLNRSSLEEYNTFRGVSEFKSGKFRCELYLQGKKFYLGLHLSELIAAYVHDKAVKLSGICNVTLNFESDEDFKEKLQVIITAELSKKKESMSKEDWAKFDHESFTAQYKESIPSDAVISRVVVDGISWTDSLKKESNGALTGGTVVTHGKNNFIGVYMQRKGFQCLIMHNGKQFYLGTHSSELIAARVYDKAATLLGKKKLNFQSDEEFEEKLQVVITAELSKKKESMSKEELAKFDEKREIAQYKESIPSDAVISRVVVDGIPWADSLNGNTVVTKKVIGVQWQGKGFQCLIYHNGTRYNLGTHSSELIAARVYDKAATLLGKKKLNFQSDEEFEEKLQVAITAELSKKKESMSKEELAKFDEKREIAQYTESIPSDAVISRVVVDGIPWADSLNGNTVITKKVIGVQWQGKGFQCRISHNGTRYNLGFYSSELIAARVYDKAATLLGKKKLNFQSDEDFKEKLQVIITAELSKKKESMSKEELAKFDQESFTAQYKESIPSDAVISRVVVDGIPWKESSSIATENEDIADKQVETEPSRNVAESIDAFSDTVSNKYVEKDIENENESMSDEESEVKKPGHGRKSRKHKLVDGPIEEKKSKKRQKDKDLLGHKKIEEEEEQQEWVQCEKCEKWHRLPRHIAAKDLPDEWFCSMNDWDPRSTESIPSDAVISRVVVDGIPWADSLNGNTVVTKKVIGVYMQRKGFQCLIMHNGKQFYLGTHSSELIAARVYDKAATLLGKKKLNFQSDEEFEEKLQVVITAELSKKKESMSKEELAKFDQESFTAQYKESIPSDAVISRVVVDGIPWKESSSIVGVGEGEVKKPGHGRKSRKHKLVDGPIEEKKSKKRQKDKDSLGHKKIEEEEEQQEWVQCEKCEKWHRLPRHIAAKDLPDEWFCSMNDWDPRSASCAVQEDYKVEDEKTDDNAIVSTSRNEKGASVVQT